MDFYVSLNFLQFPLENIFLTDTVSVRIGRQISGEFVWDKKVHNNRFSVRKLHDLASELGVWLTELGVDASCELIQNKQAPKRLKSVLNVKKVAMK